MMKIPKSKKVLIPAIAAVALLVIAITGLVLRNSANSKYNKVLESINESEQRLVEYFIEETNILNQTIENENDLRYDDAYDHAVYKGKLNDNDRIIGQFETRYRQFCENFEADYYDSKEIPENGYFLLSSVKKENLKKLRELLAARETDSLDCDGAAGLVARLRFDNVISHAVNDLSLAIATNYEDRSSMPSLAKFASSSFEIQNLDAIVKEYGAPIEQALNDQTEIFKLFYESYDAAVRGNAELSTSKFDQYQAAYDLADASAEIAQEAYKDKLKDEFRVSLQRENELFSLIKKFNNDAKINNYTEELWSAQLLASALNSYSVDNDGDYYESSSVSGLYETLKSKQYITVEDISLKDVRYSSKGDTGYLIAYKNNDKEFEYKILARQ